jgi:yecA family protein
MKPKARQSTRYGTTMATLLPPSRQSLGVLTFSSHDFAELDAWLAEDGWPEQRMDSAMLEGYMYALIVWPMELSPGAWLPQIWGINGWKVAAKIATPEKYNRFIFLAMGLFQELERRLGGPQRNYSIALNEDAPYLSGRYFAGAAWATGFITALHQHSSGIGMRSPAVRMAVEAIAEHAPNRMIARIKIESVRALLTSAVFAILSERPQTPKGKRVPLNPLTLLTTI